jgi:3-hydroxyacyl-CoA dehydrogenase/enoyl-CoA hydratase/3-hydroxybutyryl-CoA epimerase
LKHVRLGSWTLEVDPDRIAWLTCDTPGASTNVLSAAVLKDLAEALGKIAELRPAGVVVCSAKRERLHCRRRHQGIS